jgi:hypothetical protein
VFRKFCYVRRIIFLNRIRKEYKNWQEQEEEGREGGEGKKNAKKNLPLGVTKSLLLFLLVLVAPVDL